MLNWSSVHVKVSEFIEAQMLVFAVLLYKKGCCLYVETGSLECVSNLIYPLDLNAWGPACICWSCIKAMKSSIF